MSKSIFYKYRLPPHQARWSPANFEVSTSRRDALQQRIKSGSSGGRLAAATEATATTATEAAPRRSAGRRDGVRVERRRQRQLQSSTIAYEYGVSGPFWYASGTTVQVLLFAILAVEVKRKAPNAHTFLKIIQIRYGKTAHIVFMAFACVSRHYPSPTSVVNSLTGMSTYAACILIPVSVTFYVVAGGLKATFLTDYIHTCFIYVIVLLFGFTVYSSSSMIGSPSKMYILLMAAAAAHPVSQDGQYPTMASTGGIIFGIINVVGNFGTMFVDQAYWQRAIAARPSSTVRGYLIGGLCWFTIPFFLATTLGLAAIGLKSNPVFPTYPDRLASADVSAGLVTPNAAVALLGSSGAVAILILVFIAVTSASSAELIAVASIVTYDIYRTYFKPSVGGDQLVNFSHWVIAIFGVLMGVLGIILAQIGVSLGYLYLLMGVIVSPAVCPIFFALTWRKQNIYTAVGACIFGFAAGISAWLASPIHRRKLPHVGRQPRLARRLGLFSVVVSLIKPDDFDWAVMHGGLRKFDEPKDAIMAASPANAVTPDEEDPDNLPKPPLLPTAPPSSSPSS
ncbi:hypothetical protein HK405_004638 [Cladochytrium tenue]|nr:hypothetical protein HK405_004638 [Cladochytrium tenue]